MCAAWPQPRRRWALTGHAPSLALTVRPADGALALAGPTPVVIQTGLPTIGLLYVSADTLRVATAVTEVLRQAGVETQVLRVAFH